MLGMGLGLLYRRYQSLYPVMICHFAINFLSTFVMERLFWWLPESLFGVLIAFVLGMVFTFFAVFLSGKKHGEKRIEQEGALR